MKKILIIALLLLLPSCTTWNKVYQAATTVSIPQKQTYIALNAFDGLKITATKYLKLPKCGDAAIGPVCREPDISVQVIDYMDKGTVLRNNLKAFTRSHPGSLGVQGDYDALVAINDSLNGIFKQNNIK